jgi:putative tryptophan/tyrosine transport system substrate-binding protein
MKTLASCGSQGLFRPDGVMRGWGAGDGGAPAHLAADGLGDTSDLAADPDLEPIRIVVAAIALVAVDAADRDTCKLFEIGDDGTVIPIVFATAGDPVGSGLVATLARPGGNVTGVSSQGSDTAGKRLELLREVVPGLRRFAVLANLASSFPALELGEVQAASRTLGLEVSPFDIRRAEDITLAFEALKGHAEALYVIADPLASTNRIRINTLALGVRLPTMHVVREFVEAGGLMSYGPNWPSQFRRAADFVDKILRGAKPAELPVEQPTKFDLVVNLITARALGLTVPPTLLARADEVIE